jgi:predicted nucleic acid-binding protein
VNYLLDTTVIIDYSLGLEPGVRILESLFEASSELYVCEVVTCESLSGGTPEELVAIEGLLDALEYVAVDPEAARWAGGRRRASTRGSRRHIGDALIAGLAWRLGATIVTRNARDFEPFGIAVLGYGSPSA